MAAAVTDSEAEPAQAPLTGGALRRAIDQVSLRRHVVPLAVGLVLVVGVAIGAGLRNGHRGQIARSPSLRQGTGTGLSEIRFTILDAGNCQSKGYQPINEGVLCNTAAMALDLADQEAMETDFPDIPEGCYFLEDSVEGVGGLWLGTNPDNKGNGANVDVDGESRKQICLVSADAGEALVEDTPATTTTTIATEPPLPAMNPVEDPFKVGDLARVRDTANEDWEEGKVTAIVPLMVQPRGWRKAFPWIIVEHVEPKEPSTTPAPTPSPAPPAPPPAAHDPQGVPQPLANVLSGHAGDAGGAGEDGAESAPGAGSEGRHKGKKHHKAKSEDEQEEEQEDEEAPDSEKPHERKHHKGHGKAEGSTEKEGNGENDDDEKPEAAESDAKTTTITTTTALPKAIIKGISYAPVPAKHPKRLDNDDFMSAYTEVLWGRKGRGDLGVIRAMGANAVRLYGNDPSLDHSAFLDEAKHQGLDVIVGLSDYPYIQMQGSCVSTNFDCHTQIKEQFSQNLATGFLDKSSKDGAAYHPALKTIIIMNEPDLKFFPISEPSHFCKALVSAFDAVLSAEKDAGIGAEGGALQAPLPNFTATFSFAVCTACEGFGMKPAIGQMLELRKAMKDPSSVGYVAQNDLWEAYKTRFVNSFNTANPATDIRPLFLDAYDEHFQGTPVFIGEYHSPNARVTQSEDMKKIVEISSDKSTLLMGLSFFEFQVRYDKGGSELMFGVFGLGDDIIDEVTIKDRKFNVRCLSPQAPPTKTKAPRQERPACGLVEAAVAYVVDTDWQQDLPAVVNPDDCCTKCKESPRCESWTWDMVGYSTTCSLKGGRPEDDNGARVPKQSAVSGFPPPRNMEFTETEFEAESKEEMLLLVPEAITEAFGGEGVDYEKLCKPAKLDLMMYV